MSAITALRRGLTRRDLIVNPLANARADRQVVPPRRRPAPPQLVQYLVDVNAHAAPPSLSSPGTTPRRCRHTSRTPQGSVLPICSTVQSAGTTAVVSGSPLSSPHLPPARVITPRRSHRAD